MFRVVQDTGWFLLVRSLQTGEPGPRLTVSWLGPYVPHLPGHRVSGVFLIADVVTHYTSCHGNLANCQWPLSLHPQYSWHIAHVGGQSVRVECVDPIYLNPGVSGERLSLLRALWVTRSPGLTQDIQLSRWGLGATTHRWYPVWRIQANKNWVSNRYQVYTDAAR